MKKVSMKSRNTVEQFIKAHVDKNDQLKLSVKAIAEACGLSTATIWRILKQLKEDDTIYILPSLRRSEAQTIIFNRQQLISSINNDIIRLYEELNKATEVVDGLAVKIIKLTVQVKALENEYQLSLK